MRKEGIGEVAPPTNGDLPFVLDTWRKSYRQSRLVRDVPNRLYSAIHSKQALNTVNASTTLVCKAPGTDVIISWICGEPGVLHYAYTKHAYRRYGLCHWLLHLLEQECGEPIRWISFDPWGSWKKRYIRDKGWKRNIYLGLAHLVEYDPGQDI